MVCIDLWAFDLKFKSLFDEAAVNIKKSKRNKTLDFNLIECFHDLKSFSDVVSQLCWVVRPIKDDRLHSSIFSRDDFIRNVGEEENIFRSDVNLCNYVLVALRFLLVTNIGVKISADVLQQVSVVWVAEEKLLCFNRAWRVDVDLVSLCNPLREVLRDIIVDMPYIKVAVEYWCLNIYATYTNTFDWSTFKCNFPYFSLQSFQFLGLPVLCYLMMDIGNDGINE